MDVPTEVMEELKCGECDVYLSRGPVYLQPDGAAACSQCFTPGPTRWGDREGEIPGTRNTKGSGTWVLFYFSQIKWYILRLCYSLYHFYWGPKNFATGPTTGAQRPCFSAQRSAIRNEQYEAAAKLLRLRFPCKNQDLGCRETVPFADEGQDVAHEATCEYRPYLCPVLGSSCCDRLGTRSQILQHCRAKHPDRVLDNPCRLTHDITTATLNNYVIEAFQQLFQVHIQVYVTAGRIYYSVQLLDGSHQATDFIYTLKIKRNEDEVTKKGDVAPQGCLALQESTALVLDINSLLSVLSGWDGTTFTLALERRVLACSECGADVTVKLYRNDSGWWCENCAPARRACENQDEGCTHQDIPDKCDKHQFFFCEQSIWCWICEDVPHGTLSSHYTSTHMDITYSAGTTWRPTETGLSERYYLVTCPVGTAVCLYSLNDAEFYLCLYMPVLSERLCEFRCEVRVTQPITGLTHTYTPNIRYDEEFDWRIQINQEDFPSWNCEYDVSVNISKI